MAKGLTEDNIEKCAEFLIARGKRIGDKFSAYLEKRKTSNENEGNNEISPEVQQEVKSLIKEVLRSAEKPVYLDGIMFFLEISIDEEIQKLLEEILTNIDYNPFAKTGITVLISSPTKTYYLLSILFYTLQ